MTGRLPSAVLTSALLRRVNDSGGMGMVRVKGDAQGGAILVIATQHGADPRMLERGIGPDGRTALIASTAEDAEAYWRKRRSSDPDLWVIEVDIAEAERLVAEMLLDD